MENQKKFYRNLYGNRASSAGWYATITLPSWHDDIFVRFRPPDHVWPEEMPGCDWWNGEEWSSVGIVIASVGPFESEESARTWAFDNQ